MDYSCYRCHTPLEPGNVFCPHCRAPLIRVPVEAVAVATAPGVDAPAIPPHPAAKPGSIDWNHGLPAAAMAGLIAATLMVFPFAGFGLGMILAGGLAALFYRRRAPYAMLTPGTGMRLGIITGLIGFGIYTVFFTVVFVFTGTEKLRGILLEQLSKSAVASSDPQYLQALEYFKTPQGLALALILGLVTLLVIFLIFSAAGGALGALWVRRRQRP